LSQPVRQLPLRVRLRDTARLAGFVPGRNEEVFAVLAGDWLSVPRTLWLWGRAGTGKTHLLQAACAAVGERGGAAAYFDLATMSDGALLEGCEGLDLVCLDALDAVAGDAPWNAAIFRLYTLMQDGTGRMMVASVAPPASLSFALPDLRSRLLAAAVHQLHELDESGQLAALRLRAARRGLDLSDDAALYLVRRLPRDLHTLCGVLDQLDEASLAAQRRLTIPFLRETLDARLAQGD
jgi:DnaA-homolog protein